jgi:RND family efflux transporter MFP subunit
VELEQAMLEEMAPRAWVSGTVVSRDDARLAAEIPGRLVEVAEIGTAAQRGAVVARIDTGPLELQRRRDEAGIRRLEARLTYLDRQLERLRKLTAEQISARVRLDELEAEREMAHQDLELARITLDQTLDQLKRSAVRAPFPGQVVERLRQPGEAVDQGTEVVRLVNVARPEIRARVSPEAVAHLRTDALLTLLFAGHTAEGRVRTIVPVGDDRSRLFEIRLRLPEGLSPHPLVGTAVRVEVPEGTARSAVTIPRDALVLRSGRSWVFRVTGDTAERRDVETGTARGDRVEILSGIEAGDRVVVRGAERLTDGQRVVESSSG